MLFPWEKSKVPNVYRSLETKGEFKQDRLSLVRSVPPPDVVVTADSAKNKSGVLGEIEVC